MTESTLSPDGQWMWTGSEWIPAPPVGGDVFSSKNESISVNKYPNESSAKSNDSIVEGEFETLDRFMLISEQFFRWFPLHQHKWLKFLGINFTIMFVSFILYDWIFWGTDTTLEYLFGGVMVVSFGLLWLHAPITIIGIYISKRASKKELNMEISLKQELDLAVSAHELIASIAHNSEDFHLSKKLQPYGLEIQRAADSRFIKNIVLTTAATMTAGTIAHQITKSK